MLRVIHQISIFLFLYNLNSEQESKMIVREVTNRFVFDSGWATSTQSLNTKKITQEPVILYEEK